MPRVAVITDTDSSLPVDLAKSLGIIQVPINIEFGDETLLAVDEIDDSTLFARVDREGKLPTTSAPSPGMFADAYRTAFDNGAEEVVCFTVSSKVSAVYTSALNAVELVEGKPIHVIDTGSLSLGQGFIVLAAGEAALEGKGSREIISYAMEVGSRAKLYAALPTLKYLAMSGRVGYLAAGIANIFDLRPILTLKDGGLNLLERSRTEKKSWQRMIELSNEAVRERKIEKIAFLHVCASSKLSTFKKLFSASIDCPDDGITSQLTPGLSVHAGAGVVGVSFVLGN